MRSRHFAFCLSKSFALCLDHELSGRHFAVILCTTAYRGGDAAPTGNAKILVDLPAVVSGYTSPLSVYHSEI